MELSADQRFLLQLIWIAFDGGQSPTWPDIDVLQQQLDNSGMDYRQLRDIGKSIPRELLHLDRYSWRGSLRLTVEGLTHCDGPDQLLDAAYRFVGLCVDRYREANTTPPTASMSRTEVAGRLRIGRPSRLLQQLYLVVQEETYLYGGSSETADGEWVFHVKMDTVREFLHVKSLRDYRDVVARLEARFKGKAAAPPEQKRVSAASLPFRPLGSALVSSIGRGASDAVSQATKWIILTILIVAAVALLAVFGLKIQLPIPKFPGF